MSNREFFNKRRIQQDAFGMWDDATKLKNMLGGNAFKDVKGLADALTDALNGTPVVSSKPFPKINVSVPHKVQNETIGEEDTIITIEAALAGFSRDEISVELSGIDPNTKMKLLTISAEKTINTPNSHYSQRELTTSKASRDIHLCSNHDVDLVSYNDGILTINVLVVEEKPPAKTKFTIV